jgi:hypothetical protein
MLSPVSVIANDAITDELLTERKRIRKLVLIAAVLVVSLRLAAPFEVGKDQTLQLEAAQRLIAGLGLTSTYDSFALPFDITQAPQAKALTWWPPLFSLLVAGLLQIGLPLLVALKLIYAAVTLLGWSGWSRIAAELLATRLRVWGRYIPLGRLIALLSPLFYTLSWGGTDIFLWAGIPFLVLWLRPALNNRSIILAGLLLGLLYGVRYASSFLFPAGLLILLQTSFPDWRAFGKRAALFLGAALLAVAPVIVYVRSFTERGSSLPEFVDLNYGLAQLAVVIDRILNHLPVISNSLLGVPLLEDALAKVNVRAVNYLVGLCCLVAMLALPWLLARRAHKPVARPQDDLRLSLSFLPLALLLLLLTMVFVTDQYMIEVRRYHEPIRLYPILIYYSLLAAHAVSGFVKTAVAGALALFLFYVCLLLPANLLLPTRRADLARVVLGYTPARSPRHTSTSQALNYPSWQIYSLKENSRAKLRELHAAHPEALFFVDNYPFYVYDHRPDGAPRPGEQLRRFPDEDFWQQAYTSRAVKIFWVMNLHLEPLSFVPEAQRRLIFSDQYEKTLIYESDFPAGYKFIE